MQAGRRVGDAQGTFDGRTQELVYRPALRTWQ